MQTISVLDAAQKLDSLVDHVVATGSAIELKRDARSLN